MQRPIAYKDNKGKHSGHTTRFTNTVVDYTFSCNNLARYYLPLKFADAFILTIAASSGVLFNDLPYYYIDIQNATYKDSHRKLQAFIKAYFNKHIRPFAQEWEEKGETPMLRSTTL